MADSPVRSIDVFARAFRADRDAVVFDRVDELFAGFRGRHLEGAAAGLEADGRQGGVICRSTVNSDRAGTSPPERSRSRASAVGRCSKTVVSAVTVASETAFVGSVAEATPVVGDQGRQVESHCRRVCGPDVRRGGSGLE